ncbi:hypothetical protein GQF56_08555 [Rhodobacter sphaeroides]|jgi:hypothetical protein|uniref:Uncharacterized protein n=1 Tax=Cereibacter sphaeroides (strain ATCC 17023 / DSM 158 / JCM 6121 / CCUG 31486 / LMG 2827 / NBRC 12203 / NCIMB 8253 / ATH 2.4.1.) TaxID=272943 RepID=Q3J2S4_CERS4|nr:hypothetical protein [Cereibacter sphaeroides]ABA78910.2 hypothetical protein RSP_2755 [Cereibacter sphaeroides 2.4.1]AMJ47240.1 hypothetical protein APX01_06740 [Cereibacter sphaeroides]ANS33952.1 hypothetical protein A3858_06760 [Cereibacter sphaeroides]ATN62996.1 hypothetical protein A3857_06755 [Cereibacter sphaeroides]AXC61119.1 hypothetical protein DQL45_06985 [Cereibacter sphaeroides 2.4.1]
MPPKSPPLIFDPARLDALARIADQKTAAVRSQTDRRHDLREKLSDVDLRRRLHADKMTEAQPARDARASYAGFDGEGARLDREAADLRRQMDDLDAEISATSREAGDARATYRRALELACAEGLPLSLAHIEAARVAKFDTMASELAAFSAEVGQ